jgi:hypothetical protein
MAACFEPLARDRIWLLADGVWPKKGFNGDGAVASYLNDKGDNHGPHGNNICNVRAVQRVGICPHSHEPRASTDPIHAAALVVLHPNRWSP